MSSTDLVPRVLLVTNDFPPRPGGIQSFLYGLVSRLPAEDVVVYTSQWRGWEDWDAQQPFTIVREQTSVLLPTAGVRRRAVALMQQHDCDTVWFGAAAPLGLLAPALRRGGAQRIIATTHGHEAGWAASPGARQVLRHIANAVDVVTYLGDYTRSKLVRAVGRRNSHKLHRLSPGVDTTTFRPGLGNGVREALDLRDRPVVVCVSRLMPRKGQDVLIRAWPRVQSRVPDAALLLVGGGPSRARLERLAESMSVAASVVVTGSVEWPLLPAYYGAGDVFAMPCRTRLGGVDVEGLGIVFLEAASCGLPVVAGNSGGAPDAVADGVTGHVVDGRSVAEVTSSIVELLTNPDAAAEMGRRGRTWVEQKWTWDAAAVTLGKLLRP